jgi:hypothetical protein
VASTQAMTTPRSPPTAEPATAPITAGPIAQQRTISSPNAVTAPVPATAGTRTLGAHAVATIAANESATWSSVRRAASSTGDVIVSTISSASSLRSKSRNAQQRDSASSRADPRPGIHRLVSYRVQEHAVGKGPGLHQGQVHPVVQGREERCAAAHQDRVGDDRVLVDQPRPHGRRGEGGAADVHGTAIPAAALDRPISGEAARCMHLSPMCTVLAALTAVARRLLRTRVNVAYADGVTVASLLTR